MASPKYRIEVRVFDSETARAVAYESMPYSVEGFGADEMLSRVLRSAERARARFEAFHYPKSSTDQGAETTTPEENAPPMIEGDHDNEHQPEENDGEIEARALLTQKGD